MEDQVTTMSRLDAEKGIELLKELTPEQQKEQKANIMNGFHYARKVLQTNECDILILDESLGLIDSGIVEVSQIMELLELAKDSELEILLTGRTLPDEIRDVADVVTQMQTIK